MTVMTDVYCIELSDICGSVVARFAVGFAPCLVGVREMVASYPKLRLRVQNMDRASEGHDGLTLAEHESVAAAAVEARQVAKRGEAARLLWKARACIRVQALDEPRMFLRSVDRMQPFLAQADQLRVERIVTVLRRRMFAITSEWRREFARSQPAQIAEVAHG